MDHAEKLGITKNITHIPYTPNVSDFLIESDIFLLGSYVEGFPNALIESLSVGVPAITYNIPGGIYEIIQEGINSYIALTDNEYLSYMISDKKWNSKIISDSVRTRYGKDIILKQYEALFN